MSERCVIVRSLKEFRGITRGCTVRETAGDRSWSAVVDRALAPGSDTGAIPSGFRELDGMLGGFQPGSLTLICGQAGVGTSTLLLDIVRHNVFQREQARVRSDIFHRPCVTTLYSTDRTERDIAVQITAAQAKVRWHVVANGPTELEDALDWDRAMTWTTTNSDAPLRIMATQRLTLDTILDDLDTQSRTVSLICSMPPADGRRLSGNTRPDSHCGRFRAPRSHISAELSGRSMRLSDIARLRREKHSARRMAARS